MESDSNIEDTTDKKSTVKDAVLTVDDWKVSWEVGKIGFHKTSVHELLVKYKDHLLAGREHVKILFPLCGKALDMKWIYDQGHHVVGVETSEKAVKEFFEESNLEYTVEPMESINGKHYKSADNRIQIFECDFFLFNKDVAGQFDAIWDRGSLVAINVHDRPRYSQLIKSLMAPGCRCLVCTLTFDASSWPGPPHIVPDKEVFDLYEDTCSIEKLCTVDSFEERHRAWGTTSFFENVFLITFNKDSNAK